MAEPRLISEKNPKSGKAILLSISMSSVGLFFAKKSQNFEKADGLARFLKIKNLNFSKNKVWILPMLWA